MVVYLLKWYDEYGDMENGTICVTREKRVTESVKVRIRKWAIDYGKPLSENELNKVTSGLDTHGECMLNGETTLFFSEEEVL